MESDNFLTRIGVGLGVVKRKSVPLQMRSTNEAQVAPGAGSKLASVDRAPASPQRVKLPIGATEDIHTIIPPSFRLVGDIVVEESIVLQGTVRGNIEIAGEHQVVLAQTAGVHGNVKSKIAVIGGEVHGDLAVERLILLATAIIHGNIEYSVMNMADGATVNGRLTKVVANVVGEIAPAALQTDLSQGPSPSPAALPQQS